MSSLIAFINLSFCRLSLSRSVFLSPIFEIGSVGAGSSSFALVATAVVAFFGFCTPKILLKLSWYFFELEFIAFLCQASGSDDEEVLSLEEVSLDDDDDDASLQKLLIFLRANATHTLLLHVAIVRLKDIFMLGSTAQPSGSHGPIASSSRSKGSRN